MERELNLFMVSVYDKTEDYQKMINSMKKVIQLDPKLNKDEQILLSYCYKLMYSQIYNAIMHITSTINEEIILGNKLHVEHLTQYKIKLMNEMENFCNEIIGIIDDQLLPSAIDDYCIFTYLHMKAKFYNYLCKNSQELRISDTAYKAKECYEKAINYINKVSTPDQPNYQGFYLNYTTFLYEIMGQKIEAIEISKKIYDKGVEAYDEIMEQNDCIYSECTFLLQLLKLNADEWTKEMSLANE